MNRDELAALILSELHRRCEAIRRRAKPPAWKAWEVRDHADDMEYGPLYSPGWFGVRGATEARRVRLLVSAFFKGHNKKLFETFAEDLREWPNARLAAARSHCKIVCFENGAADGLVFEGSANLRTNGNREQLTVIRDRQLHDWHAAWIDEVMDHDERHQIEK